VGEFAQAGFLKPLDQVVGSEVNDWDGWSQIPKPVTGIVEFEGKRYGIPVGTDGRVLFFNKKLFAKAGLPTDRQPKSWDEVLQAGRQLKARLPGVTPLQINAGTAMGEATTAQGFIPLLYGTGKNLVDGGKWLGDPPRPRPCSASTPSSTARTWATPGSSSGPTAATAPSPSSPTTRSPCCWRATTSGAASSTPTAAWPP